MLIEHVAFNVSDPVAMAQWLVTHLGMRIVRRLDAAPFTHFIADSAGRGVLELYYHAQKPMPDYASLDALSLHVAFTSDDVAADRQRLLAAGATPAGEVVTTDSGDVMTFVRSPWGVTIQLVKRVKPLL